LSRVETRVRVYRSVEELPETLEPGKYLVEGVEVEIYEPASREELAYQLRVNRELIERYGRDGWV